MKNYIFRIVIINIMLFCFILLFEQCRKGRYLGTISFTEEGLNMVPYKSGDVISFQDSLGNRVQYTINRYSKYNKVWNVDPSEVNNINLYDYYMVEENDIFLDGNGNSHIISLTFSSSPFASPQTYEISLDDANFTGIGIFFSGGCGISTGKLYRTPNIIMNSSIVNYYDNLTLLNKNFNSVYCIGGNLNYGPDYIASLFYTFNQGIVGLRTNKGYTWCIN